MSAPNELSFLPEDYLERKAQRRTNAICAALFLITMTGIGSAFAYTERTVKEIEETHAEVGKRYAEAAKRITLVTQMQQKQRTLAAQAELASSLLEKVPRSFILAELTNSLPAGVSLLDFTLDSRLRALPTPSANTTALDRRASAAQNAQTEQAAPRQYDVTMKVTGIAYTDVQVAQFISSLNRSRMLRDVNLIVSESFKADEETLRKFQIEFMLDPAAKVDLKQSSGSKSSVAQINTGK